MVVVVAAVVVVFIVVDTVVKVVLVVVVVVVVPREMAINADNIIFIFLFIFFTKIISKMKILRLENSSNLSPTSNTF